MELTPERLKNTFYIVRDFHCCDSTCCGLCSALATDAGTNDTTSLDDTCLLPDGRLNVLAVEDHMARTVWSQWQQFAGPSGDDMDAQVKESMQQASAVQVLTRCLQFETCPNCSYPHVLFLISSSKSSSILLEACIGALHLCSEMIFQSTTTRHHRLWRAACLCLFISLKRRLQ